MLAALSRHAQLRLRIAEIDPRAEPRAPVPSSLRAILSENVRLERILASLERQTLAEPERDELPPVVHDDDAAVVGDPPVGSESTRRDYSRRALLSLGVFVPLAVLVVFSQFALEPNLGEATRPPREAKTVRLTGAVVSRSGTIDVRPGERCEVTIADSGDREAGRACHIEVRCPSLNQGFLAASCPIGEPKAPVRMRSNGLEIDEVARTVTFIAGWDGEVIQGGATLHLDAAR